MKALGEAGKQAGRGRERQGLFETSGRGWVCMDKVGRQGEREGQVIRGLYIVLQPGRDDSGEVRLLMCCCSMLWGVEGEEGGAWQGEDCLRWRGEQGGGNGMCGKRGGRVEEDVERRRREKVIR